MPESRTAQLDTDAACDVCPHPRQDHDPIGVRYCTATTASALPRGCICP
ncbi:RGCVC family protein [Lentzea sp. E54]